MFWVDLLPMVRRTPLLSLALLSLLGFTSPSLVHAQAATVAPLLRLLESGRLPAERQGTVVEMICTRGEAADLAVILRRLVAPDGFSPDLRPKVMQLLTDAAVNRKVRPEGDLAAIGQLIETGDQATQAAAIRLAGAWQLAEVQGPLVKIAGNPKSPDSLRQAALAGLASLGKGSLEPLERLAQSAATAQLRLDAAAALVRLDLTRGAARGAEAIAAMQPGDDPAALLEAILSRQGGTEALAAALANVSLGQDSAKRCLSLMYSVGRSDAELSDVLSKAAKIALDAPPPSAEEVARIVADVAAKGDPARGEKIFRRSDLSCLKCHSVSQAGGSVGPDLSPVGSISPVDYIVNSILHPNLAIKEQYVTRKVLTFDGEVFTGIQIDRDDQRLRLKDAAGKTVVIPVDNIDQEAEGASLMPQGITKFLTQQELLDLARFVSELGKPGPYAVRPMPGVQRWRVLKEPGPELTGEVPNVETLRVAVLDTPAEAWQTAYAMVGGTLPLAELAKARPAVLYLQGQIEVTEPGAIALELASSEPTQFWIDGEPFEGAKQIERELPAGKHTLTLRVEVGEGEDPHVRLDVRRPEGSAAQFVVINGT
jgi:putative heme-binding domain-containing protein